MTEERSSEQHDIIAKLEQLEAKVDSRAANSHTAQEPSLGEINRSILRLETKVDKVAEDHEVRMRRVERWMYALPITILTSIGATGVAVVSLMRGS